MLTNIRYTSTLDMEKKLKEISEKPRKLEFVL